MHFRKYLFSCVLIIFSSLTQAQVPTLIIPTGHTTSVESAKFSPNGKYIASASSGMVKVWDAKSGKLLQTLRGSESLITGPEFGYSPPLDVKFSHNSKYVVLVEQQAELYI